MADESENPLRDNITCAVCFEIYINPYALKCLHTFCHKCIKQIESGGRVQCPNCREYTYITAIIRDFRTQGFVDIFKKHGLDKSFIRQDSLSLAQPTSTINCDMCASSKSRSAVAKCLDCDQFMCSGCTLTHSGISLCRNHTVGTLDKGSSILESMKQAILQLKDEKLAMLRKSNKMDAAIRDVRKRQASQMADVDKQTDALICETETNRTRLHHMIMQANDNYVSHLFEGKHLLDSSISHVQDRIDHLSQAPVCEDPQMLQKLASEVDVQVNKEINTLREKLRPINVSRLGSPVSVEKGSKWDVRNAIQVKIMPTDEIRIQPESKEPRAPETSLQELSFDCQPDHITHVTKIDLDYHPHRVYMIGGQLWCLTLNAINIYDKELLFIKKVNNPHMRFARGIARTTKGQLIIACSNKKGLLQLNSNCEFQQHILSGSFADVCHYRGKIYILESDQGKVLIYENENDKWFAITSFNLTCGNIHARDRLFVQNDLVYVSSSNNNCLYVHTLDGEFKYQSGQTGSHLTGHLSGPLLCNVDSFGNALVADYSNHRLQVCERGLQWCIVILPGSVNSPVDALTDETADNTWVVTHQPDQMIKFTM